MFEELFNNVNLEESKLFTPEELEKHLTTEQTYEKDDVKGDEKDDAGKDQTNNPNDMLSPKELEEAGLLSKDQEPGSDSSSSESSSKVRSEEHTSELQSRENLVCRLLLEKKNK